MNESIPAPPLSLYIHLPWCVRKCPYCDFNSYTAGKDVPRARYLDALIDDLGYEARRVDGRELVSVFLGGGTPSFFTPEEIRRLIDTARSEFSMAADVEITMEANPGTVECGSPAGYRAAGVNRLSIGAQSFTPAMLTTLGRIHSVEDIVRTCREARNAGFTAINLDLMYALPGQDVEGALADLEAALALDPEHLSWYQLTLEPNTVYFARPPAGLPDDSRSADIQEAGQALLGRHGYEQYEVSAWARDGHYCRHNLNYWTYGDYVAAGAGAHGKLTNAQGVCRYRKPANPLAYIEDVRSRETATPLDPPLPPDERLFEFMLNALRLPEGFSEDGFAARTGLDAASLRQPAADAARRGLLERRPGGRWRPTPLGRRFLNDLQAGFLPASGGR